MNSNLGPSRFIPASILLHFVIFLFIIGVAQNTSISVEQEIYSVSIEAGSKLGGVSRIPEQKDREKAVVESSKIEKKTLSQTEKKELEALLNEKTITEKTPDATNLEKKKHTPTPTVRQTPKTTPNAKQTPTPIPKATKKPTPTPKPKIEIDSEYSRILKEYLGESTRAGGEGIGAGRIGPEKGYGGGILKDPEWIKYRDTIIETIKKNWFWQDRSANLKAVVSFNISPDGRILNVKLVESSGVPAFDQSCVKAVMGTPFLPPPPMRFYQDFQKVEIIFIPQGLYGSD